MPRSREELDRAAEVVGEELEESARAAFALRDICGRNDEQTAVLYAGMLHLRQTATFLFGGPNGGYHPDDIKPSDFLDGLAPWLAPAGPRSAWYANDSAVIDKGLMHLSWERVNRMIYWKLSTALDRVLQAFEAFVDHLAAEGSAQHDQFNAALTNARSILA